MSELLILYILSNSYDRIFVLVHKCIFGLVHKCIFGLVHKCILMLSDIWLYICNTYWRHYRLNLIYFNKCTVNGAVKNQKYVSATNSYVR